MKIKVDAEVTFLMTIDTTELEAEEEDLVTLINDHIKDLANQPGIEIEDIEVKL